MLKIQKLILIGLTLAHCDLIGFNRLGNNVISHDRFRNLKQQRYNWLTDKVTTIGKIELMNQLLNQKVQISKTRSKRTGQRKNAHQKNRRRLFLKHYNIKN